MHRIAATFNNYQNTSECRNEKFGFKPKISKNIVHAKCLNQVDSDYISSSETSIETDNCISDISTSDSTEQLNNNNAYSNKNSTKFSYQNKFNFLNKNISKNVTQAASRSPKNTPKTIIKNTEVTPRSPKQKTKFIKSSEPSPYRPMKTSTTQPLASSSGKDSYL